MIQTPTLTITIHNLCAVLALAPVVNAKLCKCDQGIPEKREYRSQQTPL